MVRYIEPQAIKLNTLEVELRRQGNIFGSPKKLADENTTFTVRIVTTTRSQLHDQKGKSTIFNRKLNLRRQAISFALDHHDLGLTQIGWISKCLKSVAK